MSLIRDTARWQWQGDDAIAPDPVPCRTSVAHVNERTTMTRWLSRRQTDALGGDLWDAREWVCAWFSAAPTTLFFCRLALFIKIQIDRLPKLDFMLIGNISTRAQFWLSGHRTLIAVRLHA